MAAGAGRKPATSETHDILRVVDALADMEDHGSYGLFVLKVLASVLYFDVGSFNEVDPNNDRAVFCSYPENVDIPRRDVEMFPLLVQQNPILQYQHRTGDGSARRLSDFISLDELHELELYRRIYQPLRIDYQVAIGLVVKAPVVVAFALNRCDVDFAESELALLNALRPHLSHAYRNVRTIEALRGVDSALAELGEGVVVLEEGGLVARASPWAEDVMRQHFGPLSGSGLPQGVERWVAEERGVPLGDGRPRIHRPLVSVVGDDQLVLRFLPGSGIRPDVVAIDEHRAERILAELRRLGLTHREAGIMQQFMQGESAARAARNVGIAPATLNKHLEHVYRKLGVTNRSAAVAAATDALFGLR